MAGLGLRYCPQHPTVPLVLATVNGATFWRCEHDDGCTHSEPILKRGAQKVVAVNGHRLNRAREIHRDNRRGRGR